jgi:hypothetical protein
MDEQILIVGNPELFREERPFHYSLASEDINDYFVVRHSEQCYSSRG